MIACSQWPWETNFSELWLAIGPTRAPTPKGHECGPALWLTAWPRRSCHMASIKALPVVISEARTAHFRFLHAHVTNWCLGRYSFTTEMAFVYYYQTVTMCCANRNVKQSDRRRETLLWYWRSDKQRSSLSLRGDRHSPLGITNYGYGVANHLFWNRIRVSQPPDCQDKRDEKTKRCHFGEISITDSNERCQNDNKIADRKEINLVTPIQVRTSFLNNRHRKPTLCRR